MNKGTIKRAFENDLWLETRNGYKARILFAFSPEQKAQLSDFQRIGFVYGGIVITETGAPIPCDWSADGMCDIDGEARDLDLVGFSMRGTNKFSASEALRGATCLTRGGDTAYVAQRIPPDVAREIRDAHTGRSRLIGCIIRDNGIPQTFWWYDSGNAVQGSDSVDDLVLTIGSDKE